MKKIFIADDIKKLLDQGKSFLDRASVRIFTASSHEEALKIHNNERLNLIITRLDMPGMSSEMFCSIIREDRILRQVSLIIICDKNRSDIERSSRCNANAIIISPVDPASLLDKVYQFLHIAKRGAYRVLISLKVEGKSRKRPFLCRSENISTSGMLIETERVLAKGDRVSCSFFLPDSTHIVEDGEVIRVVGKTTEFETNQYGIKFLHTPSDSQSALEDFIEKQNKQERFF
jgi:DNA-binding response OmpR family regulator